MGFPPDTRVRIQRKTWCMGPFAGVDYNLTLCPLQHMYHGHGHWATLCRSRLYPPVRDLGFRLRDNQIDSKVMSYLYFGVLCLCSKII